MTPTEEKAQAYAMNLNYSLEARLHLSAEDFKQAYLQGAKDILSLPLSERLTDEEKKSLIDWHNGRIADIRKASEKEAILYRGEINMLNFIFGTDFFKEGGNDGE